MDLYWTQCFPNRKHIFFKKNIESAKKLPHISSQGKISKFSIVRDMYTSFPNTMQLKLDVYNKR